MGKKGLKGGGEYKRGSSQNMLKAHYIVSGVGILGTETEGGLDTLPWMLPVVSFQ